MMWLVLFLIAVILCLLLVVMFMRQSRLKVPMPMRGMIRKQWEHVRSIDDAEKRLMEAEKVLHHALRSAGQEGSFGDILKRTGPRIGNLDAVWNAHKLRNRLAHEPGFHPSASELDRAVGIFERILLRIIK